MRTAARAAGVSHRSSSHHWLRPVYVLPHAHPGSYIPLSPNTAGGDQKNERSGGRCSPKPGIFKRCPALPAWGGEPGLGGPGWNRVRPPSLRTHLVVNDAQDQGAAGAGGHVLAVLQVLLQNPGRAVRARRLPGPRAAPPVLPAWPGAAAPHPRDEEAVPAGARVAVGPGLLVVLEVLDLHLVVKHGHGGGKRRAPGRADGKRRRLRGQRAESPARDAAAGTGGGSGPGIRGGLGGERRVQGTGG